MKIRNPYNYDMDAASVASGFECKEVSMTQQHFAEECDINTIVRRFGLTGQLPTDVRMPLEGGFDGVIDYKTAADALIAADEMFMLFPASVRERFKNDPGEFIAFCHDERNRDEAIKLGIVPPKPVAAGAAAPAGGGAAAPAAAAVAAPAAS